MWRLETISPGKVKINPMLHIYIIAEPQPECTTDINCYVMAASFLLY